MVKLITILSISIFSIMQTTYAQEKSYFNGIRIKMDQSSSISELSYHYHKLLNLGDNTESDIDRLYNYASHLGFNIQMYPDNSFKVLNKSSNAHLLQSTMQHYDLENGYYPLQDRYASLNDFLDAANLKQEDFSGNPSYIPDFRLLWIHQKNGDIILDAKTLKPVISHAGQNIDLLYGGNGLFISNDNDKCWVYRIRLVDDIPTAHKKIDFPNAKASMIVLSGKRTYIVVETAESADSIGNLYLYNQQAELVMPALNQIIVHPESDNILIQQGNVWSLYDKELNLKLNNCNYIYEVIKDHQSYWLTDDTDDNRKLFDMNLNILLSDEDYRSISIDTSPYAVVRKKQNKQYGVIDFVTKDEIIPFQDERIRNIRPGFMYWQKDGVWHIADDEGNITAHLHASNVYDLGTENPVLLKAVNEAGKYGVYNLLGEEIAPMKYDDIQYKNKSAGKLVLTTNQKQQQTDLRGNKID